MPKKIDHEKRKEKILQTALKVFAREGYRDSNLSLIAQECGISRPTIYQYFRDKEEIYYYAVKLITGRMFTKYATIAWDEGEDVIERIIDICDDVMDMAQVHAGELSSLINVMVQMKKEGKDFSRTVMRRIAKLHILFMRMIRSGIAKGELIECDANKLATQIVLLLESLCLQYGFLDPNEIEASKELISTYLHFFRAQH